MRLFIFMRGWYLANKNRVFIHYNHSLILFQNTLIPIDIALYSDLKRWYGSYRKTSCYTVFRVYRMSVFFELVMWSIWIWNIHFLAKFCAIFHLLRIRLVWWINGYVQFQMQLRVRAIYFSPLWVYLFSLLICCEFSFSCTGVSRKVDGKQAKNCTQQFPKDKVSSSQVAVSRPQNFSEIGEKVIIYVKQYANFQLRFQCNSGLHWF